MAKNKKLRKQLEGIRNDLGDLYNTINELVETIQKSNSIWQSMGTTGAVTNKYPITLSGNDPQAIRDQLEKKFPGMASPSVPGSPENPVVERQREPKGFETAPEDLATNPMGGEPVRVDEVTPNLDKEASPYTFWFTPEELERLGIADMSYHLEEVPGREGRLRIVPGPPTQLLPGHEEMVREKMAEERKNSE